MGSENETERKLHPVCASAHLCALGAAEATSRPQVAWQHLALRPLGAHLFCSGAYPDTATGARTNLPEREVALGQPSAVGDTTR